MVTLSNRSMSNRDTCCAELIKVVNETARVDIMDFTVIQGHRGQLEQDKFFKGGKSRVRWPKGKHNQYPSEAVDIVPYVSGAISWEKIHCAHLAGIILGVAKMLGITLRWGGNWDMDYEPVTDQDFQDLVHFEMKRR